MFTDWAEFTWYTSAGPQKLNTVTRAAFGTNTFRRFFAEADGLNTLDSLFGVAVSLFCFQCHFSIKKLGLEGAFFPGPADIRKNRKISA
jgi:hypothetical protein